MSAIEAVLTESIDYAGLFQPAALDMASAVANYAQYRTGNYTWALGRFVVPASRLAEFEKAAAVHIKDVPPSPPWRLSVLAGPDLELDLQVLGAFNQRHARTPDLILADTLETKATSERAIEKTLTTVPPTLQTFIEVPIDESPARLLRRISKLGGCAKIRTGGVTVQSFPRATDLLRFIRDSLAEGVPFKATAGLHHPLRADYRLTYADDSPIGRMFGFLNLFLATALVRSGLADQDVLDILEETSATALNVGEDNITWRDHRLELHALRLMRTEGMLSFGSCSFTEPLADLEALNLLPRRVQPA